MTRYPSADQLALPLLMLSEPPPRARGALGLTFRGSKTEPFHRWYPYVEGFSAQYVRDMLAQFPTPGPVYDPFGGAGTTLLEASRLGTVSGYAEVNPFMRFVAETKINAAIWAREHFGDFLRYANAFRKGLRDPSFEEAVAAEDLTSYHRTFPGRDYFKEVHLRELLGALRLARRICRECQPARDLLILSVVANAVRSSNMTRRADLRRRRSDEYKKRVVNVRAFVEQKLMEILADLRGVDGPRAATSAVAVDAKQSPDDTGAFRLAITSPPYLNGTNYFRNTKIELWLLGHLSKEDDLGAFRSVAVAGGINNVRRGRRDVIRFKEVETVVSALEGTDGDRRIPLLVRYYFSDMYEVMRATYTRLRRGGRFVLDIGDSKFYGVNVPTDQLIVRVAGEAGFKLDRVRHLADRLSYDKTPLRQVDVVLRKP
jgi:hypothetical protein